jgi:hypothetical protein
MIIEIIIIIRRRTLVYQIILELKTFLKKKSKQSFKLIKEEKTEFL